MALLALVFFAVLATAAIAGFLVYRIVKPQRTSSEIDMESFPGKPDLVDFAVSGLGTRHGWFFPGLRGAPTIILVSWVWIKPWRTVDAGFGAAGSSVQRVCF